MKKKLFALLLALTMLVSLCACGSTETASEPKEETLEKTEVTPEPAVEETGAEMIPCYGGVAYADTAVMSDGQEIFCVVIKPTAEGTYPVVYMQTCYASVCEELTEDYIASTSSSSVEPFVKAGYAVVLAETRGTGSSTYESYLPYEYDAKDELETLDWVRQQDFYAGEIYFYGASYLGYTALIGANSDNEDIKGICAECPVSYRYDAWYQNGFMKVGLMAYWQAMCERPAGFDSGALFTSMGGDMSLFNTFPYIDWPVTMYGTQEEHFTDIITHAEDEDWWESSSAGHEIYDVTENIDCPLLLIDRFYDIFFEDSCKIWNNLSEEQRAQSCFYVQQYPHSWKSYVESFWPFTMTDDEKDMADIYNYAVEFFDSIRAGTLTEDFDLGAVTYRPIDGDRDFVEEGTLTNGTQENVLYLNAESTLGTAGEAEGSRTYVYDPNDPAVFTGGDDENAYGLGGAYSGPGVEAEPNSRQDILSFVSEEITEETYIKGVISGDIEVSSDCEDTCFLMRFYVVRDGSAYGVREDITSLCYQLGDYTPGEKVTLHFETSPVVLHLQEGDSIRVDISSSSAGLYSIHTNVKGNQWEIAEPVIANNTVYTGVSSIRFYTEKLG